MAPGLIRRADVDLVRERARLDEVVGGARHPAHGRDRIDEGPVPVPRREDAVVPHPSPPARSLALLRMRRRRGTSSPSSRRSTISASSRPSRCSPDATGSSSTTRRAGGTRTGRTSGPADACWTPMRSPRSSIASSSTGGPRPRSVDGSSWSGGDSTRTPPSASAWATRPPRAGTRSPRSSGSAASRTRSSSPAASSRRGGRGGIYDRFRGRLIWPIRDITGNTIGFGGARKLLESDQGPKYLNTPPETAIYRKSHVLYGLDLARKAIAAEHRVVVVEGGYTDVMAAHLAGVTTAVASCGTAFGSEHVKIVRRVMGGHQPVGRSAAELRRPRTRRRGRLHLRRRCGGQKAALRASRRTSGSSRRPTSPSNPAAWIPASCASLAATRRSSTSSPPVAPPVRVRHPIRDLPGRSRHRRRTGDGPADGGAGGRSHP